jgi:hypothetical protein
LNSESLDRATDPKDLLACLNVALPESNEAQVERRNVVSSAFIGLLTALAFGEAVPPVRDSVRADGLTLGTAMLSLVFFLTIMRFFIGALLHLVSREMVSLPGRIWFFDFMVITAETVIFIFLGGLTSMEQSERSTVGFVTLLIAVYLLDIAWIVAQWALGMAFDGFRRPLIPWKWAVLNGFAVAAIVIPGLAAGTLYSPGMLIWLGVVNTVAFIVDVVLVDYWDVV